MAQQPTRRTAQQHHGVVLRTERLTPHLIRIVLGGPGLADFPDGEYTDRYVKLLFPPAGVVYPEPFDIAQVRAEYPRDQWPATRTYTVRAWDPASRELTLDVVVHGTQGLAGPWALRATPGEEVRLLGPGGAYAPDPDADWHLLAGDESALPAIAAALERMPHGVPVHALIEVAGPEEELPLATPPGVRVRWLHRADTRVGTRLRAEVHALDFPAGRPHAFVHGEAGWVKDLRRHLRLDRGVPRAALSVSGYWRLGSDEDGWQASKREWNERVEAEQERPSPEHSAAVTAPADGPGSPAPAG
ncbi:siderophore-interacting protein [Streptomyces sp. AJS327]|uniref:siderophore-interacting protein n=1 Tax=Streptomyces sp. AJS327 TaxID=2545265 RepID=UPI0015DF60DD|nr:siderophore-interacting protein [Streptomyces sp. AJS327]MBA0050708.1 siderophore-interacting protein [Streptomyces sp. AJS327]